MPLVGNPDIIRGRLDGTIGYYEQGQGAIPHLSRADRAERGAAQRRPM